MANFCCSIETEPRTLNQGQLNYARDVAVDIVQKKEPEDATIIFNEEMKHTIKIGDPKPVQGLMKPVVEIKETAVVVVSDATRPHKAVKGCSTEVIIREEINVETNCQCAIESSPEESIVKEPLSAPF